MSMVHRAYEWFHDRCSRSDEKGEYSAGAWQDLARRQAVTFLAGATGRVLEIGCGEGLFLAQLAAAAPAASLYGIDNDEGRLVRARERLAIAGAAARSQALFAAAPTVPFPDGFFDATACVNVTLALPSVSAVAATLAEMARVTAPGGKVIVEYRNADNLLLVLKYRLAPHYDETVKGHPFTMLTAAQIAGMCADLGLAVTRRAYLPASFARVGWLRRIAPIIVVEAAKAPAGKDRP